MDDDNDEFSKSFANLRDIAEGIIEADERPDPGTIYACTIRVEIHDFIRRLELVQPDLK